MNIEAEVLITILRTGGGELSVGLLHKRIAARAGGEVVWRDVARAVTRLINLGHVRVDGEVQVGLDMFPAYALTAAGDMAARTAQVEQRNAEKLGTPKRGHDSAREGAA